MEGDWGVATVTNAFLADGPHQMSVIPGDHIAVIEPMTFCFANPLAPHPAGASPPSIPRLAPVWTISTYA
jgi:hypothetical protein